MGKTVFDPVPSEKATVQSEILDLGFHNSLLQHDMWPIFSLSKITAPYSAWSLRGGGTFFRLSYTVYTRTAYQQMFSDQPTVGTWCCSQSSTPSSRLLLSRSLSGSAAGAFSPTPTEDGKPNENFFFFVCGS